MPERRQLCENEHRYNRLLAENKLFCAIDIVKELLHDAFNASSDAEMADKMDYIMDVCNGIENPHFKWFANNFKPLRWNQSSWFYSLIPQTFALRHKKRAIPYSIAPSEPAGARVDPHRCSILHAGI